MAANFLDLPVARSSGSARMTGFRAGKCVVEGTRVSPDPRKGRLQICDGDDGLVHVQWMVRGGDETRQLPEEDLIVINDAYLEKIPQCTDGRVYCLRFTSSDKKLLFWMQEPDASRDEALVSEFNRRAGGTPPSTAATPAAATTAAATTAATAAAQPGATNTAVRQGSQAHTSYDDNLQQLRRLLADYSETLRRARESSAGSSATGVSLGDVLSSQVLRRIGEDPVAVSELTELMPENCRSAEDVRDALHSPQLAAAMRGLTQALYVDPAAILSSMGVSTPSNSLSGTDPVAAFAQALENNLRATDTTSPATATEPNSGPPAAEQAVNDSSMPEAADAQPRASSSSYTSSSTEKPPEATKDTNKS